MIILCARQHQAGISATISNTDRRWRHSYRSYEHARVNNKIYGNWQSPLAACSYLLVHTYSRVALLTHIILHLDFGGRAAVTKLPCFKKMAGAATRRRRWDSALIYYIVAREIASPKAAATALPPKRCRASHRPPPIGTPVHFDVLPGPL